MGVTDLKKSGSQCVVNGLTHYARNKSDYVKKAVARRKKMRAIVQQMKVGRPCMDCGGKFHHAAMEYDHRPGEIKCFNISIGAADASWEKVLTEIAKCDLVCANCHAVRSYTRMKAKLV